jgi:hypothetical protein
LRQDFCATEGKRKHLTYVGRVSSHFCRDPGDFRRPDWWWYSGMGFATSELADGLHQIDEFLRR